MGGDPSLLEKAGRSRICLSDNEKSLKADCGFGLDRSKSSDALLLRRSDAEVSQDRAAVLTEYDFVDFPVDGKEKKLIEFQRSNSRGRVPSGRDIGYSKE